MTPPLTFATTNTILYCRKWQETVDFYRYGLQLPITHASDWFVEFKLTATAHISVADERRASIHSSQGAGITLTFQVADIRAAWQWLQENGLTPGPLQDHAWGAQVFYFHDPEGHRLEFWSPA
jgi:uncharacterized glyoxalase superfamily protein PhnB